MNRYILIVDLCYEEQESHALYFSADNGDAAEDYASRWMLARYGDDYYDEDIVTYELHYVPDTGVC